MDAVVCWWWVPVDSVLLSHGILCPVPLPPSFQVERRKTQRDQLRRENKQMRRHWSLSSQRPVDITQIWTCKQFLSLHSAHQTSKLDQQVRERMLARRVLTLTRGMPSRGTGTVCHMSSPLSKRIFSSLLSCIRRASGSSKASTATSTVA
jgi:chemotaxis regulatin CheY-phosphate phosphatase CheZ